MVNVFVVQGNLVADPVVRQTKSGSVCNFRLANNINKDKVLFLDVSVWGKQGDLCGQYLKKGRMVIASGVLSQETWGDNKTSLVLNAHKVDFLDNPKSTPAPVDERNYDDENTTEYGNSSDSEIPF